MPGTLEPSNMFELVDVALNTEIASLLREKRILVQNHEAQQEAKRKAGYAGTMDHRNILKAIAEVDAELDTLRARER